MEEKILTKFGLTPIEAKVYLAILNEGASLAGRISRNSGVHRRSVYDALERLIQKGLVSYIEENNRRYYYAENPENFMRIVEEEKKDLQLILPKLNQLFEEKKEKRKTVFFRGKLGLKTVFGDQLKEGKEILIIGGSADADKIIKYYFPRFDAQRKEKNLPVKALFYDKDRGKIGKIPLAEVRFLPRNHKGNTATNIYGNKVAIIVWQKEPIAILINNRDIAESYREYFNTLWSVSKI